MTVDMDLGRRVYLPEFERSLALMDQEGLKLAYYTRYETAVQIIEGRAIWMRNTRYMNDVGEIQHGIDAVDAFFAKKANQQRMHAALGGPLASAVHAFWLNTKHKLIGEIYITCVSQHWPSEDDYGRLSMWRGYCNQPDGVALVLNVAPFRLQTNELNAYSSPVLYGHAADFEAQALQVLSNIQRERAHLGSDQEVLGSLAMAFLFGAVCLKHPGFAEEQEWRVIHMPTVIQLPTRLRRRDGVLDPPQTIFEIPLESDPAAGLVGLAPGELIDRIIVGPSNRTFDIRTGLAGALANAGVADPWSIISVSGIPLRPL